jgi:hypothetical protein
MQKRPYEDQAPPSPSEAVKRRSGLMSDALRPLSAGLGPQIAALEQQAKAALGLLDRVRQALPEPDKTHVLSASYHDDVLVVTTDSAAWCAHLRYQENALRERLVTLGEKRFTVLKVRVGRP